VRQYPVPWIVFTVCQRQLVSEGTLESVKLVPNRGRVVAQKRKPLRAPSSRRKSVLYGLGGAAAVGVLAAGSVANPLVLVVIAGLILTLVLSRWPEFAIYAMVCLAIVALPSAIPMSFAVGGISVRLYEPFLFISVVVAALRYRLDARALVRLAALVSLLVFWVVTGLANGHDAVRVLVDTRLFAYLCLALFVAASVAGTEVVARAVRLIPAVLWISAGTTIAASVLGFGIAGMQIGAAGSLDGSESADRLISPATYASVAVLCAVLALWLTGKKSLRATLVFTAPALTMVFLSFTRNAIISIAVACVFAVVASKDFQAVRRVAMLGLVLSGLIFLITIGEPVLRQVAGLGWALNQFDAFSGRVLGGITGSALAADGSAQFRFDQENVYLVPEIFRSPVFGHGYGYAYKPLETGRFVTDKGEALRYYAHNFYLWILVKAGVVGFLLFAFSVISPVLTRMNARSTAAQVAAGAAAAGLLAASFVAPMPLGAPTSVVLGVAVGLCVGGRRVRLVHQANET
jgi:hypothetical protein